MRSVVTVAVALCLGCGGSPSECAPREPGAYQITVAPTAPNLCEIQPGTVVSNVTDEPIPGDADCTGSVTQTDDGCSVSFGRTCAATGGDIEWSGGLRWNHAGTRATGLVTYQFHADVAVDSCVSTVELTYERL